MNKLFRNSIMLIVFRTLTALSLAIILILISRAFGPEGKGIFAMLYFIPLLAFNLGHLGIGTANTYFISKDKTNAEKILFNSLLEGLFLGIFFIGLFFLIAKIYPALLYGKLDPFYIWLILLSIPFIFWERFMQGIFVGKQEFVFFNAMTLLNKLIIIAFLILQINFFKNNIEKIAISYTLITISLPIIFILYLVVNQKNIWIFDWILFKAMLSMGLRTFAACTLAFLVIRLDIFMINLWNGLSDVGLYSLAVNFTDEVLLIASSIALALLPHINENSEQSLLTTLRTTRLLSSILIVILTVSIGVIRMIVLHFFGERFLGSLPSFYVLAIAVYFLSICTILSQFFASKNFPWKAIFAWLPGLILNIILNCVFIPKFGIVAAAVSSLIAYILTFALYYRLLQEYGHIPLKNIFIPNKDDVILIKAMIKNMNKKYE